MFIRQATEQDNANWDAYVQSQAQASPYHLFAWRRAVEDAYGYRGYYLLAERDSTICGILPLIHMKFSFLQNQLVGLPYCDVGHPVTDDLSVEAALLSAADSLAKELGARTLEIRARQNHAKEDEQQSVATTGKVSMLLELPGSSAALWNGFKSKLRSQIRKAEKNELTFKWGQQADLDLFYSVFSQNMHELGSPVHSKKWIQSVLLHYGDRAKMGLVFLGKTPVGCGIILLCGKTVSIPWASTLREFNKLSPNMLLYWNFLQFSADNGFSMFDFGRSTLEEGTYKFKQQWGASPVKLKWNALDSTGKWLAVKDSGQSERRKLVKTLWQNVPLFLANYFGPYIRKNISL